MKVRVTDEHITHGRRRNCQECPLALAVVDALKAAGYDTSDLEVTIFGGEVTVDNGADLCHTTQLTESEWGAVENYDDGDRFRLREFELWVGD